MVIFNSYFDITRGYVSHILHVSKVPGQGAFDTFSGKQDPTDPTDPRELRELAAVSRHGFFSKVSRKKSISFHRFFSLMFFAFFCCAIWAFLQRYRCFEAFTSALQLCSSWLIRPSFVPHSSLIRPSSHVRNPFTEWRDSGYALPGRGREMWVSQVPLFATFAARIFQVSMARTKSIQDSWLNWHRMTLILWSFNCESIESDPKFGTSFFPLCQVMTGCLACAKLLVAKRSAVPRDIQRSVEAISISMISNR